jgi:hypothetical protein
MVRGQRFLVEDVQDGPSDPLPGKGLEQRALVDEGPRPILTSHAEGFMRASSRAPMSPWVAGVRGTVRTTKSAEASGLPRSRAR